MIYLSSEDSPGIYSNTADLTGWKTREKKRILKKIITAVRFSTVESVPEKVP